MSRAPAESLLVTQCRAVDLAAVAMIEDLDAQITEIDRELKIAGVNHRYILCS
jgi:hypothetical protein